MKPFQLDTVLNYRQRLEDLAQNRLMSALQAEQQIQIRIEGERRLLATLIATASARQQEGIAIGELIDLEEHIRYVRTGLVALQDELAKRQEKVAAERRNLQKRSKEKQAMEKLKEKQNAAWRHHLDKKEAAMLDEIAIIYHQK